MDRKTIIASIQRLKGLGILEEMPEKVGRTRSVKVYRFATLPPASSTGNYTAKCVEAVPETDRSSTVFSRSSTVFGRKQYRKRYSEPVTGTSKKSIKEPDRFCFGGKDEITPPWGKL